MEKEDEGICILSLDNGGSGSLSQLVMLKEYSSRFAYESNIAEEEVRLADHFHMMGGVGFGGLLAIMLGCLRMTVDEAMDALVSVASAVFSLGPGKALDPETNSKNLKEAIEGMLRDRGLALDTKLNDRTGSPPCKVVIYAASSANLGHPQPFRNYLSRASNLNVTILEAICATMSSPPLFSPVKIGPRLREQSFVGGPVGAQNPTKEVLREAFLIFGKERRVAQILSLGTGSQRGPESGSLDSSGASLAKEIAADCEAVAAQLLAWFSHLVIYLRLNVDRGLENAGLGDWDAIGAIESHTMVYLQTSAIIAALDTSFQHLQTKAGPVTLGQINGAGRVKISPKSAPSLPAYYVVREREANIILRFLHDSTNSQRKIFPITGMGGCGKTQLVSYILREAESLFNHTIFVDASSSSSIKEDLQAWARSLGNGHEQDVWEDALRILANRFDDGRWVLVLDNADDPTLDIVRFIPKTSQGTILITSRNREIANLATAYHLEMGEMPMEEALSLLVKASRRELPLAADELESAHNLIKELGSLPLALVQSGAHCAQLSSTTNGVLQPYTFTQYLTLFRSHRAQLMKKTGPSSLDGYKRGVFTTLDLSYTAIPPHARDFAHFASYFHGSSIPFAMLVTAAENSFKDPHSYLPRPEQQKNTVQDLQKLFCTDGRWDELRVQEIIRTLRSFSLLSLSATGDSSFIHLHPLVRAWLRDMDPSNNQDHEAMARQTLVSSCVDKNIELYSHLSPHIDELLGGYEGHSLHVNDQMAFGKVLAQQGRHRDAEKLFGEAYTEMTKMLGEEAPETLSVAGWLAGTYKQQGQWGVAERLQLDVLDKMRRILGKDHPDTVRAAANLAATYHEQERWVDAEKLGLEILEQTRRVMRMEHQDSITAAANLATTYSKQGRLDEAVALQEEVVEQMSKINGREHPDYIRAAANLAATYHEQGRLDEAEALEVEVLEQMRRLLGPEHPDSISAASNLGATFGEQGRYEESGSLQLEVLEQRRRLLGSEHPDTISAAANLAANYRLRGQTEEAERLLEVVLDQRRRVFGMEHPRTIAAAANLAAIYQEQGRWEEAEKLQNEVLTLRGRVLGTEHTDTLNAVASLASTYRHQARWIEAEALQTEVLEKQRRLRGQHHPDTVGSAAALAATFGQQGKWAEAEQLQLGVLQSWKELYGREHPETMGAASSLVITYRSQEKWSIAETLQLELLEWMRNALGMNHARTLNAATELASTYSEQRKWHEAENIQAEVLQKQEELFGRADLATIRAAVSLAAIYTEQEKFDEAETLQSQILDQRKATIGHDHLDTISAAANLAFTYNMLGRWDEAEVLQVEVLAQRRQILGEKHPYTVLAEEDLAATDRLRTASRDARPVTALPPGPEIIPQKILSQSKAVGSDTDSECSEGSRFEIMVTQQRFTMEHQAITSRLRTCYLEVVSLPNDIDEGPAANEGLSYDVPLIGLNLNLPESSILITANSTFSQIGCHLYSSNPRTLPVALEMISGPKPQWRIPNVNTKIPHGLQKIYVADISEPFVLALVRSIEEDYPLVIPISPGSLTGTTTVGELIGAISLEKPISGTAIGESIAVSLQEKAEVWHSINLFSHHGDIQRSRFDVIQKDIEAIYSTSFFVLLNNDPLAYRFRDDENVTASLSLRVAFLQCQSLVASAPRLNAFAFQSIHASRALLHLVISLADAITHARMEDTVEIYFISRIQRLVVNLKEIFQDIKSLKDTSRQINANLARIFGDGESRKTTSLLIRRSLRRFFEVMCQEQPGVVPVRHSYAAFMSFSREDGSEETVSADSDLEYDSDSLGYPALAGALRPGGSLGKQNPTESSGSLSVAEDE